FDGWFRGLDADSNGRVSRKEWQAFFDRMAQGKDHITPEDLRAALRPPPPAKGPGKKEGTPPRDLPLRNLLRGALGSPRGGPRAPASPGRPPAGRGRAGGAASGGRRRVVLVLGSFT